MSNAIPHVPAITSMGIAVSNTVTPIVPTVATEGRKPARIYAQMFLRHLYSFHGFLSIGYFPTAYSAPSLRRKIRPFEIAGDAISLSPISFFASTFASRPLRSTKVSPVSLTK